jgi:hypothetical protein
MFIIKKYVEGEKPIYLSDYLPMSRIEAQTLTDRLNKNTGEYIHFESEEMPDFNKLIDNFIFEKNYNCDHLESIESYNILEKTRAGIDPNLVGQIDFIETGLHCDCVVGFSDIDNSFFNERKEYYKRINENMKIYKIYTFYNLYRKTDIDLVRDMMSMLFINTYISLKTKQMA